jgi:hypothetical protein
MFTHREIIQNLGGIRSVARELGHTHHTKVQGWSDRSSIPVAHWPEVIALSERLGQPLSSDELMRAPTPAQADAA